MRKMKKILVFALVLTMLMPLGSAFAADEEVDASVEGNTSTDGDDITEEEEDEVEEDESMDIDYDTTVDYIKTNMSQIGKQGEYTIYTGTTKNKKELDKLINNADSVDEEEYTPETYSVYAQALAKAKTISANVTATQRQLDEVWIELDRAHEGLVKVNAKDKTTKESDTVDKSKLEKAIGKLDADLVSDDYTEYTWEIYQSAVNNANAIMANANATQAEVDAAKEELKYVEDKLTKHNPQIIVITKTKDAKEVIMSTFEVGEAENGRVISTSKKGFWIVETDVNVTRMSNFYMRLLSELVEDAFMSVDLQTVFYMNTKTLEVEKEYDYKSEDSTNGRLYTSDDGRMLFTTLDGGRLLADIELVTENANFKLYADTETHKVALYDIKADKYWWNTPVNPYGDSTIIDATKGTSMKSAQRNQTASGLVLEYGDLRQEKRSITSLYSAATLTSSVKGNEDWTLSSDGITISYNYKEAGFVVPVQYILHDDRLEVTVDIKDVVEADTNEVDGKIITALTLSPYFGASPETDLAGNDVDGYMIVPDGSGAVIEYNNDKEGYSSYSQTLYGRDKTTVPLNAPRVTEQAYLPVIATVTGNTGLVAIATDGDANASVNAQVCKQNKQAFNNVYFKFNLRGKDDYYMGGTDGTRITVFEKGDIKTEKISVSYYPISAEKDEEVNYADVAAVYRNYLINEKGLEKKTESNVSNFYVDLYGGVLQETSVLGIPVDMKTEVTGFSQAEEILNKLNDGGVKDIIVNYNDWTNKSMVGKISTKFKPSGVLGGKSDYETLESTAESMGAKIFPSLSNMQMESSSWGYLTINSTAIRVSNAQSRQSEYSMAFGIALSGKSPALLTPNSYTKVFTQMIDSYTKNDVTNIGFGDYSSTLVSDFSKKNSLSREQNMNNLIEQYKNASETMANVIADEANSYVIPYADYITNVPVYSSQYNVVDYDIPFYQMVVHGYVPYSSTAVNANSNAEEVFLLSLASGSGIHYDMIYKEAYELLDTDYAEFYYANYDSWMNQAIEQYNASEAILSQVSEMVITDYQIDNETGIIKTTYDDSVVVTVDTKNATADVNGTVYDLSSALEGGLNR